MALYIKTKANVFEVSLKKSASGKDFAVCKLVFYSKGKDEQGEYTKEDPRFQVSAIAFGKNASYLSSLSGGKGFVEVQGKLYNKKYEKDGETKYADQFDIISVSSSLLAKADKEDEAEIIDSDDIPF